MNPTQHDSPFSNRHAVLPVIHVFDLEQTVKNAQLAFEYTCDGIFLINHDFNCEKLIEIYQEVRKIFRQEWIGLNLLGVWHPKDIFGMLPKDVSGVWADNAMIEERSTNQIEAQAALDARKQSGWDGLYFGGVAFKYQREVTELEAAVRIAAQYMDVVTTSGPGTGEAADLSKIKRMKQAMGNTPLAIASGIRPDNVEQYLETADMFLVATGISRKLEHPHRTHDFYNFDPLLLEALIQNVRGF